jgi:hypothetical protein
VQEFAGRIVSVKVLREFGLVDNHAVDDFLTQVFSKTEPVTAPA